MLDIIQSNVVLDKTFISTNFRIMKDAEKEHIYNPFGSVFNGIISILDLELNQTNAEIEIDSSFSEK